jgi:hypothetical protein
MFEFEFNNKMRNAWIMSSLYLLFVILIRLMNPAESLLEKLVLIGICIVVPGILVFSVRAVRGANADWKSHDADAKKLSTWGYMWRALVGYFSQIPLLLLLQVVLPFKVDTSRFTAFQLAAWCIPSMIVAVIGIWIIFSRDRRGQFAYMVASARGY